MRYEALVPLRFRGASGEVVEVQAGETFTPKSEKGIEALLEKGKVRPYWKVFEHLFREHMSLMKSYPTTIDEIRRHNPETAEELVSLTRAMDAAWYREDLPAFRESMTKLETRYLRVHEQIAGRIR
ncbi:MAG: hypothetical protein K8I29_14410 [Alphaproteobacteria bacterium]|uniref:Uncharacterized protein n=1 Tax=Candidatus Nitrobium versatile TaxID=2884831 RepID=A0A953JCB5_9BACT|nr:hypothetical protein [Candidatus Nitrobium versatile]